MNQRDIHKPAPRFREEECPVENNPRLVSHFKASRDIAVASTNIYAQLGLTSSISDEEARMIRRIAHRFGYRGSA